MPRMGGRQASNGRLLAEIWNSYIFSENYIFQSVCGFKSYRKVFHIALVTLEGHQRAIMDSMTVEEIYKDRKKFSKQVLEVAFSDLANMGITVGYLKALGMATTAEVKRDARTGKAEVRSEAQIKEAIAEEQRK
uniref:Uncharacterized protein n=1 Tax=Glossina brevipalpis TaxID=37001 RepID=A0A1A9WQH4_9MUSC